MLDALSTRINGFPYLPQGALGAWVFLVMNALIFVTFLAIAAACWRFAWLRADWRRNWSVAALGTAVFAAAITHLFYLFATGSSLESFSTALLLFTAVSGATAAFGLWRELPALLARPAASTHATLVESHRQLGAAENLFRAMAERSPEGIWLLGPDGGIEYANPAMYGLLRCAEPVQGRNLFEFIFPEDLDLARRRLAERLAGEDDRTEFCLRRADGTPLQAMISTAVVFAENGGAASLATFVSDASERIAMSDELRRLNLELGQRVERRTRELEESNRELAREIVVREYVQAELAASNERLNLYLSALQRHTDDISRLNELADQLNACESRRELIQVLQISCFDLFSTTGGALFEAENERMNLLEFGWGDCAGLEGSFAPDQCLALREGKPFPAGIDEQGGVVCMHRPSLQPAMCVPLHARGVCVGLLLLQRGEPFWSGDAASDRQLEQLLRALGEHAALALDNISLRERLREQSLSDPLTGLFNRRYLFEQMEREMAGWERSRRTFALMLIDIDHFKKFNDRYGHAVGDAVLIEVANLLREYTRRSDLACRLGGEEFVVLMTGAEQAQAIDRAEAIREAVKQIRVDGVNDVISISAGVAVYPEHGDEQQSLLRAADQALYVSKRTGRDRTSMAV